MTRSGGLSRALRLLLTLGVIGLASSAAAGPEPDLHDWVRFNACPDEPIVARCPAPDRFRTLEASSGEASALVVERNQHEGDPASVKVVTTTGGTATEGSDYEPLSTTIQFGGDAVDDARLARVSVIDDSEVEGLETVAVALTEPTNTTLSSPNRATLTIVDNDGPARVSFEDAARNRFENFSSLRVWVLRAGDQSATTTVTYATQPGTAEEGADFTAANGTLTFELGQFAKAVTVTLNDDDEAEGDESFTLALSSEAGATTEPASATITILDDEDATADSVAPRTAFHQPRQGETYSRSQATSYLVAAQDEAGGSGVQKVQLALRKRLTSGACAWLTPSGFERGSCTKKRWSRTTTQLYDDTAVFTIGKLKPSTKANGIRSYTAFSRGVDVAGNVESSFIKGQNNNTFEVRRS